jgi:uncharacterized protein (TIGR03437 family)
LRLLRFNILWRILLLLGAAATCYGQTLITLGASAGSGSGCALSAGGICTLTARVTGLPTAAVTFEVTPRVAGDSFVVVSGPNETGLTTARYTAPTPVLARQTITVTARATDGSSVAQVITLVPPTTTVQVTPSATVTLTAGQTQRFTATVFGVSQTGVTWTYSPQVGTVVIAGNTLDYTAPSPITATQTITFTATSTFDATVTGVGRVQLNAPSLTISPTTVSLSNSQQQQFTATVNNLANPGVTWSITPLVGSITQTGLYVAPGFLATNTTVTVRATSVAEPSRSVAATVNLIPAATVGSGAPTDAMVAAFQGAWNRSGFNAVVVLPPVAPVRVFGSSGYVQEFLDAENSALRHALVTGAASVGGLNGVFQILGPLWAYYSSTGANTAGYPLGDSQTCSAQGIGCVWAAFDRGYALFAYRETLPNGLGPNFLVNGAFYTAWNALGGIAVAGSPVSAQTANVTATIIAPATVGTIATVQTFARGAIYSMTSGPNRGRTFGVVGALYDLYVAQSGPSGALGMPTSEAYQFAAGVIRQNFEGGVLQNSGTDPSVLLPVVSVTLSGAPLSGTVTLNVGQTLSLQATPMLSSGEAAADRAVTWSSTNGKVVSIQANGGAAVVTALGSGAASVQAASGGIASGKVNFIVISPCCQVGDGAPATVQQAFRDALTRNRIAVQTPLPSPAERAGGGYVQRVPSADGRANYLLTLSDRLGAAYVVTGALLARYDETGGPSGPLGFPAGDASPGGTQVFANGAALGGTPVRLIGGGILTKWALLGYENGAAGFPLAEAGAFSTFGANSGQHQRFSKGAIHAATAGPRAGQAFFTSGLILARYDALGGATGDFGMPTSDEFVTGAVHQQNFEGGNLTYAAGDAVAVERAAPRLPGVVASPSSVSAGGRARIAVIGFPNNSALRISTTGSPDFSVNASNGAYTWEMAIPLTARSGRVTVRAVDGRGASAEGSFTVRGFADNRIQITKLQGDNQTGLPGSALPLALRVALMDSSNAPVAGATVTFAASPGVQLSAASALSDAAGRAEVLVRLPSASGVGAVTVGAPSIAQAPVTFFVRAAPETLSNVPKLMQAGDALLGNGTATIAQKGALLTATAAILRYHQNRGDLRAPNGPADAPQLNEFLKQYCTVDAAGAQVCDGFFAAGSGSEQVVNLWRAAEFTGGVDVVARGVTISAVIDALADGSPVLLSLALSRNGSAAGGHFVVATGVAEDGSIVIHDPNPALGRANLAEYQRGFSGGGAAWTAALRGVVQLVPRSPSATRFLVGAVSQPPELMRTLAIEVQSVSGNCGNVLDLVDAVDGAGNPSGGAATRLRACDGTDAAYQLAVGAMQPYRMFLTDLATAGGTLELSGAAPATYKVIRNRLTLVVLPQDLGFAAEAVVNAATFGRGIAPGGIMSIFGTGLAGGGVATTVTVDGVAADVLAASAFQINAVVPVGTAPGRRTVRVRSGYGSAEQVVDVAEVAPAIFLIGNPPTGAVVNQDGRVNGAASPLARGQTLVIYGTGLGAVAARGELSEAVTPVTVVLNGVELGVAYSGLTPGYTGLYQVNVAIPLGSPPGLGLPLTLKQGGQLSNVVLVAVQ